MSGQTCTHNKNDVVNAILCLEDWTLEPSSDGDGMHVYMKDKAKQAINCGLISFNIIRNGECFHRYVYEVNSIDEFYEIVVKATKCVFIGYGFYKSDPYLSMTDEQILMKYDLEKSYDD